MTHVAYRLARRMDPILQLDGTEHAEDFERVDVRVASLRSGAVSPLGWKRIADIVLSLIAIIVLSPVMLVTAIAVKLTSPGPVFFTQERVGLDKRTRDRRARPGGESNCRRRRDRRVVVRFGRSFAIYKFRTMVADAENGRPVWATQNDPRITPLGRFLRLTRVDELPQFINVLNGDMSIVGPRPERAYFIGRMEKDLPEFQLRLRAKPGITGLAQVELGYTNTNECLRRKLGFDLEYIRLVNPWTDAKILFKTIYVVLTGRGAC